MLLRLKKYKWAPIYFLILVTVFLFFLIATVPANVVAQRFLPNNIVLHDVFGSAWKGSVREVQIQEHRLQNITWDLNVLPLFIGKVSYDLTLPYGVLTVAARGRNLEITNTKLEVLIEDFIEDYHLPVSGLFGVLKVNLIFLELDNLKVSAAEGSIEIEDFGHPMLSEKAVGNYILSFSTTDEGIINTKLIGTGDINASGEAFLYADHRYQIDGLIAPVQRIENDIASTLALFSRKNNQGHYVFKASGTVPAFK